MLRKLPPQTNENVLVGFDTSDDAGVYRLTADLALVQTVDFFTPIVDDPYTYGQIAAANSLSDVYAMGGRPISALSIVGYPGKGDPELLEKILLGGLSKMDEAACVVIGGHTIADEEMKFGYAVTGVINPKRVYRNAGARPGDSLLLTKPLGTGVIATALKKGRASEDSVAASIQSMSALNRAAAEVLIEFDAPFPPERNAVHAMTDITGFGLLGHAREMASASAVGFVIDSGELKFLPGAREYAREGFLAGGLKNNREFYSCAVAFADNVPEEVQSLLFDPQTSGGLLIAVEAEHAGGLTAALNARGVRTVRIGEVVPEGAVRIQVRGAQLRAEISEARDSL